MWVGLLRRSRVIMVRVCGLVVCVCVGWMMSEGWVGADGVLVPGVRRRLELLVGELRWRIVLVSAPLFFSWCVLVPAANELGRAPFEMYDYQESGLASVLGSKRSVVLKARQLGWTTIMSAVSLWQAMHKGSTVLYVSKNQDTANKALGLVRFMWTFMPSWVTDKGMRLTSDQSTQMEWTWPDGSKSRISSLAATKTAGAGETVDLVIVDEFALSAYQDDALRTLLPTIQARGGRIVVFSTARGAHNRFARLFKEAWYGESDFTAVFHPWMVSRIFDADDYEAERVRFLAEPWLLYAEYPSTVEEAFRESGRPRFGQLPAQGLELGCSGTVTFGRGSTSGIAAIRDSAFRGIVWDEDDVVGPDRGILRGIPEAQSPLSTADYVIAVDPASGTGGDFTAIHVVRRDGADVRVVAMWSSNMHEPVDAARIVDVIGRHFGGALLVVETTGGWGDSMLNELAHHLEYPNLYVHVPDGPRQKAQNRYGYPMSWSRRPKVIDRLASMLRYDLEDQGVALVRGIYPKLLAELQTFVTRDDGKVAADVGCHDDLVMSLAIAVAICTDHGEQLGLSTQAPVHVAKTNNLSGLVERNDRMRRQVEDAALKEHRTMLRQVTKRARRAARNTR
jgi:hypothetical protein